MKTLFKVLFAEIMLGCGFVFAFGLYHIEYEILNIWSAALDTVCILVPMWAAGVGYQRFKLIFVDWAIQKVQTFKKK